MTASQDLIVVTELRNDTPEDMHLYLEMVPEQLVMAPGHEVALLARPSPDLLPIHITFVSDGLQVHAHKEVDPDWHVRFRGKVLKVEALTRLADHE